MSNSKSCMNCGTTGPTKFRSLKDKKWEEAENNSLIKVTWKKGGILCHNCYMNFVEKPLQRGTKR
ncbi:17198_t:CDS:1, partial [Gigaspora rosea]